MNYHRNHHNTVTTQTNQGTGQGKSKYRERQPSFIDMFITRLYISQAKHRIDKIFTSKYSPCRLCLQTISYAYTCFGYAYRTDRDLTSKNLLSEWYLNHWITIILHDSIIGKLNKTIP